jgi:hypothetical protein
MADIKNVTNIADKEAEVKPIVLRFTDTNQVYTLEFNRQTITYAEKNGFPLNPFNREQVIFEKPIEVLEDLFYYSFMKNHRGISKAITDKILYDDLGGMSTAIMERLMELYFLGYSSLISTEEKPKNSTLAVEM